MKANLKTWPATPVEASLEINDVTLSYRPLQLLLSKRGAAGVGRPSGMRGQVSDIRCQPSEVSCDRTLTSDI
jgi:hypothetical protein